MARLETSGSSGGSASPQTRAEAAQLRDALDDLIEHFDRSETTAWHAHVSSSDFQTEVNVTAE